MRIEATLTVLMLGLSQSAALAAADVRPSTGANASGAVKGFVREAGHVRLNVANAQKGRYYGYSSASTLESLADAGVVWYANPAAAAGDFTLSADERPGSGFYRVFAGDASPLTSDVDRDTLHGCEILSAPREVKLTAAGQWSTLSPASGYWNLGQYLKVTAEIVNTGTDGCTPKFELVDYNGKTLVAAAASGLKPGASTKVELSFVQASPWVKIGDANPSGGTSFASFRVRYFGFGAREGSAKYTVVSLKAEKIVAEPPSWVGSRPPVSGPWKMTLYENFDGKAPNKSTWSPYTENYWDKLTHFSVTNLVYDGGFCSLRYEKRTGHQNDDPKRETTDYVCGLLDSYDRWTQRYGYFEARMKLPTKPGLWPAFWMMPDRGPDAGERWQRNSTVGTGMEFDIMEHLTAWGPYRFNIACHWDGYDADHKTTGTEVYLPADKEGFIVVGMLWLPGVFAVYGNGTELARWESSRISDVPAHFFFDMVSGGWDNPPLDDSRLPDEFKLDWLRVWQRTDLP